MSCVLQGFPDLRLAVLVGDPKQLPATVISKLAQEHGYVRSLQERLHACGVPMHMLDTQYRMHPEISLHPAAAFHGGKVRISPHRIADHSYTISVCVNAFPRSSACARWLVWPCERSCKTDLLCSTHPAAPTCALCPSGRVSGPTT